MFLEFVQPSKEIRDDLLGITNAVGDGSPESVLSGRAEKIRSFLSKWNGKISQGILNYLNDALKLSSEKSAKPVFPNPAHYNHGNPDQVKTMVHDMEKAFRDLDSYYEKKKTLESWPQDLQDPMNRAMKQTALVRNASDKVSMKMERRIRIANRDYILRDDGLWPGHLICKIDQTHINQARAMTSKDTPADCPYFQFYLELPKTDAKDNAEDLSAMSFTDLKNLAKSLGIKNSPQDKKQDVIDAIIKRKEELEKIAADASIGSNQ